MTFGELITETYQMMRDPSRTKFNLASVKQRLNNAEQRYCVLTKYTKKKDISISTVAAQQEYALPSDYNSLIAVFYNGDILSQVNVEDTVYSTANSGTPSNFYVRMTQIGLDPIPSGIGTLTIVYHTIGGDMLADIDAPIIPEADHNYLIQYACYLCALESDDNRATIFKAEFQNGIGMAVRLNLDKAFTQFPVVNAGVAGGVDVERDMEFPY
jgi:hypothetical protein